MKLVRPSREYLASYTTALERGRSPDTSVESRRRERNGSSSFRNTGASPALRYRIDLALAP